MLEILIMSSLAQIFFQPLVKKIEDDNYFFQINKF